jgi:hypothetical protein
MDIYGINALIITFGLIGLAIWTLTSSIEIAKRRDPSDSINEFLALLLYRGLFFVLTLGVIFGILDTKFSLLGIPVLLIGTFLIDRFGKY